MATTNSTTPILYVHPDDVAARLKPGEPYMVDGLDWSWMFVVYKEIPSRSKWIVGSNGTIWRWRHKAWSRPVASWEMTFGSKASRGYLQVKMTLPDGDKKTRLMHEVVLTTFVGPCPPGMECRHLNGIRMDNRLCNLAWGTHVENMDDQRRHGTLRIGSRSHLARMTEAQIEDIFRRAASGERYSSIAKSLGERVEFIANILSKVGWQHIGEKYPDFPNMREGSRNWLAKLDEDNVVLVRAMARDGWSQQAIADHFGVSKSAIQQAVTRNTWKHVP